MKKRYYLWLYLGLLIAAGLLKNIGIFGGFSAEDWKNLALNDMLLVLGAGLGFYFVLVEKLWQVFYLYKETEASRAVRSYLAGGSYKNPVRFLVYMLNTDFSGRKRSVLNSFLFHIAWIVTAVFVLTSTGSSFGKGLAAGLGLQLAVTSWLAYRNSFTEFRQMIFWQLARPVNETEGKYYLYIFSLLFGIYSLLLV